MAKKTWLTKRGFNYLDTDLTWLTMSPSNRLRGEYINKINEWRIKKDKVNEKANKAEESVKRIRQKWERVRQIQFSIINIYII